jgi:hypothetical protein
VERSTGQYDPSAYRGKADGVAPQPPMLLFPSRREGW